MESWVASGRAPGQILASARDRRKGRSDEAAVPASVRSRSGREQAVRNDAANFSCVAQ